MKICDEGVGKGYTINDNKHALFGLRWYTILAGTRDGSWILQLSSTHVNSSYFFFFFFPFHLFSWCLVCVRISSFLFIAPFRFLFKYLP